MDPSSSSPTKRRPSKIASYTRTFLLTVLALINILGVLLILLSLGSTAGEEISTDAMSLVPATSTPSQETSAVVMNYMPVMSMDETRRTASVLLETACPKIQEQNQMVKSSVEEYYGVDIDFVNARLDMPRKVYDAIISITNEISEASRLDDKKLEYIAKKLSTKTNPVTLTNMKDYIVLEATIGKDTYVLKRMSKMNAGNAKDNLATKFNSPYIIEILMTFTNDIEEWIVMEYVGPRIPFYHADFTKEEIGLLVHDCLMGLDAIHKGGYYHGDLYERNIVYVKSDKGETAGFKIIDFGVATVKDKSQMTPLELYDEVKGILGIVKNYLEHRVNTRPKGVGYMEVVDKDAATNDASSLLNFLEEDSILAELLMTAIGQVSKPATSIADLMKHQYFAGAGAGESLFGEKEWTVARRMPGESSDS